MKLTRRGFLASLGSAAVGVTGVSALPSWGQDAGTRELLEEWSDYEEQFHVSICRQCPGECGLLVRVVDGEVVKISGNPLYPVNMGGLCMKGIAGTQVLYDPDRIRSPLRRKGKRGGGKWEPISWDEALKEVAGHLGILREAGESHTLAVLGGQYRGVMDSLLKRFCQSYGTPNYLRYRCLEPERAAHSHHFMHGLETPLAYDMAHSRFVLSFGCNLLESWLSTVHQQRIFGQWHSAGGRDRVKFVQVDTRYSVTAAKADQWVPVRPGTDGALALGLAYVIIQEGLYDREFVQDNTLGFENWKDDSGTEITGFKTLVLEEYSPEKVSRLTGVPVETLFRLAREFASHRPALAIGERGPSFHGSDLYTRMAIHSLNALVGSIGVKGGILRQGSVPLAGWEDFENDEQGAAGSARPPIGGDSGSTLLSKNSIHKLPGFILTGEPYPLQALLLYHANPLYSLPGREDWEKALEKIPFIVSFSPFMDETTSNADLILPDSTYLERWQDDQVTHLAGFTLFGIGRPVLPPIHDTRQTEDVLLQIANKLGGPPAEALPWETFEELLSEKAQGIYDGGRGHVVMPPREEEFEAILANQGYREELFESFDDFWDALLARGAWWDPNDTYIGKHQVISTPSGRFEFHSQILKKELETLGRKLSPKSGKSDTDALNAAADALGLEARGDRLLMPHYEEGFQKAAEAQYPFHFNTYRLISTAGGRGGNQPWLQQQPAVHLEGGWDSWFEINPQSADRLGIADGEEVWLISSKGRIKVKARHLPGAMPDVLNMPIGQGHTAYGRWANGRGANPNDIILPAQDPMRGLPLWGGTMVRLEKA